ncbi:hypothetical protein [Roseomonas xinghualingensis]|uniref:hypothetical protein n=1 Tax=Roseomonas xinghualingensis TaxID=2986475 RepID=UPI0021F1AC38|nr:hypothetical protein [Roseomonas sp. SXEYE001]MCV4205988.1 hypothetical protein [Roseomonas sp. SXEYE001]
MTAHPPSDEVRDALMGAWGVEVFSDCWLPENTDHPPAKIHFVLLHQARGIALIDLEPDVVPDAVPRFLAQYRQLFPEVSKAPPVVYRSLSAPDLWRLTTVLDEAFANEPPLDPDDASLDLHKVSWMGMAYQTLSPGPDPPSSEAKEAEGREPEDIEPEVQESRTTEARAEDEEPGPARPVSLPLGHGTPNLPPSYWATRMMSRLLAGLVLASGAASLGYFALLHGLHIAEPSSPAPARAALTWPAPGPNVASGPGTASDAGFANPGALPPPFPSSSSPTPSDGGSPVLAAISAEPEESPEAAAPAMAASQATDTILNIQGNAPEAERGSVPETGSEAGLDPAMGLSPEPDGDPLPPLPDAPAAPVPHEVAETGPPAEAAFPPPAPSAVPPLQMAPAPAALPEPILAPPVTAEPSGPVWVLPEAGAAPLPASMLAEAVPVPDARDPPGSSALAPTEPAPPAAIMVQAAPVLIPPSAPAEAAVAPVLAYPAQALALPEPEPAAPEPAPPVQASPPAAPFEAAASQPAPGIPAVPSSTAMAEQGHTPDTAGATVMAQAAEPARAEPPAPPTLVAAQVPVFTAEHPAPAPPPSHAMAEAPSPASSPMPAVAPPALEGSGPAIAALPVPSPAPVAPPPPAPGMAPELLEALVRRGDVMLAVGDISAARLLFERAIAAGSATAATALGRTYDPLVLEALNVRGLRADPEKAASWYRRGSEMGDPHADLLLQRLAARNADGARRGR